METISYSRIGREDLQIGRNQFEVTLANGQIVTLNEVDLGYILANLTGYKTYATTSVLPTVDLVNPGRIARVSADGKIYVDNGTAWVAIAIPTGTVGSVPFFSSTGLTEDNSNFYFDDSTNRLGIGTASNITERIVIPNASHLGGVNAAASATKKLIGLNSSDQVEIAADASAVKISGAVTLAQGATVSTGKTLTLVDATPNGLLYAPTGGIVTSTGAPTNGQIPIGSTGNAPAFATLTAGTGIAITNGPGSATIALTGALAYYRTIPAAIGTTAAETTLVSFPIAGNDLSTTRAMRVRVFGIYLNSSGSNKTIQIRVKFGGQTFYDDTTSTIGTNAPAHAWELEVILVNRNSTSLQNLTGSFTVGAITAAVTGTGDFTAVNTLSAVFAFGAGTVNTTSDQTFQITWQHSASSASTVCTPYGAIAELL